MASLYNQSFRTTVPLRSKTCIDCKFYIHSSSKCNKVEYKNIKTSEPTLLDAESMRSDTGLCGFNAEFYEQKENKTIVNNEPYSSF